MLLRERKLQLVSSIRKEGQLLSTVNVRLTLLFSPLTARRKKYWLREIREVVFTLPESSGTTLCVISFREVIMYVNS